jgi:putative oxidoreductase
MILRILHWLSRCILAGIFFYTGYIKLDIHFNNGHINIDPSLQFDAVISGYKLFPEAFHPLIVNYFPWVEITLALFLVIGWKKIVHYIAGAATGLILFFIVILTITYARGIDANCGCFSLNDRISLKTIARDSIIIIPALYLLTEPLIRKRLKASKHEPVIPTTQGN